MRQFRLILDSSVCIAELTLEHLGCFAPSNEGYSIVADDNIVRLEVDETSIVQIWLGQWHDAMGAIEEHKENPLFVTGEASIQFYVIDGFTGNSVDEFKGDFIDALLYAHNNGAEYDRV